MGQLYLWLAHLKVKKGKCSEPSILFESVTIEHAETYLKYAASDCRTYEKFLPYRTYAATVANKAIGDIAYIQMKKNAEKEKNEGKCLKWYSACLSSIAQEIELNLCKQALREDIHYKETNMIPRDRMYTMAQNRYRLRNQIEKVFEVAGGKGSSTNRVELTLNPGHSGG